MVLRASLLWSSEVCEPQWVDSTFGQQCRTRLVFHLWCHLVHILPLPRESFHVFVPRVVSVCGSWASLYGWRWVVGPETLVEGTGTVGCTNGRTEGLLSCCGLWATLFRTCAHCGVCVGEREREGGRSHPVAHSNGHPVFLCLWRCCSGSTWLCWNLLALVLCERVSSTNRRRSCAALEVSSCCSARAGRSYFQA